MHSMVSINQSILLNMITSVEPSDTESCGFFFGQENKRHRIVTTLMPVCNSARGDKKVQFEITPKDYLKAESFADQKHMVLLGVYHSHPDHPAIPSESDRKAAQPFFSYIILSVIKKKVEDVRSWRLDDDLQLREEEIEITRN